MTYLEAKPLAWKLEFRYPVKNFIPVLNSPLSIHHLTCETWLYLA